MRQLWLKLAAATLMLTMLITFAWLSRAPGTSDTQALNLTALAPDAVLDIRVQRRDGSLVALARRAGDWWVTKPFEIRANPVRAAAIASLAGATTNVFYAVRDVPLAASGLEPPLLVLALNGTALEIGARQPVDDLRYVRVEERVALLKDQFFHHLNQTVAGFVHPAPLPPEARVVAIRTAQFEVRTANGKWSWSRSADVASADAIAALVGRWQTASAMAVETMDYTKPWKGEVSVTLKSGKVLEFRVREDTQHLWLGLPALDLQYRFPSGRGRALFEMDASHHARGRSAADLRTRETSH